MDSQPAKILSKGEMKKSIKGAKKPKKNIIKNTLDNPFALEWPDICSKYEDEVKLLLHDSCLGLKRSQYKIPFRKLKAHRRSERKELLKEYRKQFEETKQQNKERDEGLSNLILGFNAVMRALEKDRIAAIIVKKNAQPPFIPKTFIPGCANKCIPLFPLNDMDSILKAEDTMAMPNGSMALGLKLSVREKNNRFHPLFAKLCQALEIDVSNGIEDCEEEEKQEEEIDFMKSKEKLISSHKLTTEEIGSYHLKRTGTGRRAFVPGEEGQKINLASLGTNFISLEPMVEAEKTTKPSDQRHLEILPPNRRVTEAKSIQVDFSMSFVIDEEGEDVKDVSMKCVDVENVHKKIKKRKKLQQIESCSYIPAKTKRLKGNPNRKTTKK